LARARRRGLATTGNVFCAAAVTISKAGLTVVRRLLAGEKVDQASGGMSARECREPMDSLGQK
jgi:hypothetical protein